MAGIAKMLSPRSATISEKWHPVLDEKRVDEALTIARDVARRMRHPEQVEAAVAEAKLQSNLPKGPNWTPHSLAQGYAGLVLLWGQLDRCFPGEGWDAIAHQHLEIAAHGAAMHMQIMPSAFGGLSGLAFVTWYVSRGGVRYQRLIRTLDQNLLKRLMPLIASVSNQHHGVPVYTFDVISGLSGIALYLLCRLDLPEMRLALVDLVRCLVALSSEENGLPRWYSPAHCLRGDELMLKHFPNGNLNCGLSHGIPGPLGALSLASLSGITCEGLDEAIDRLAMWLLAHRLDDEWGINWPTAVGILPPGRPEGRIASPNMSPSGPSHTAWCYGSPGIARSLYFAGLALQKTNYCELATQAIETVLRRPSAARRIESPTFCHGVAGLLEIVLRFARDIPSTMLQSEAITLAGQIFRHYEPDSLLGFRSMELENRRVDQPGLLDGAPGVALVLLAAATNVDPNWDRIFLLS
jgi:lantibiotic modifying enzyme